MKVQDKLLEVRLLGGLVVDTEATYRSPGSWARLENFERSTPGAIKKIIGFSELLPDIVYDSPISQIRTYRRSVNDPRMVVGISFNGFLYNIETGEQLAKFPVVNYPFVGQMQGRSGDDEIVYLITTTAGYFSYKWDGVVGNDPTPIGVSVPLTPVIIGSVSSTEIPEKGVSLVTGRQYVWTYWNPVTRHESSPSPVSAFSAIGQAFFFNTPESAPFIVAVQLFIYPDPPDLGAGYTRKRIYATRDGGDIYYLVRDLYEVDVDGNILAVADVDGSVDLSSTYILHGVGDVITAYESPPGSGFFSIVKTNNGSAGPQQIINAFQPAVPSVPSDTFLVSPGPLPGENDPPPPAIWGAIYQNRLWLVKADSQITLVYSKIGDFQSFSADNIFPLPADDLDSVTALDGQDNQLIVGKIRSLHRITGTDFTDFVIVPLDQQVGIAGRRALTHSHGILFFLSQQGIMSYGGGPLEFYGKPVRRITDEIPSDIKLEQITAEVYSKTSMVLFAVGTTLIGMNVVEDSPFFEVTKLPSVVTSLSEAELSSGEIVMCFGAYDGKVYTLFSKGEIEAIAKSQLLPPENIIYRKVFRVLKVEDFIDTGLEVSFGVDGRQYPFVPLMEETPIGLVGRFLTITFRHKALENTGPVVLSNYTVDYAIIGVTR